MPNYVISYDLDDGSDDEYDAVENAICAKSSSGQKRLDTFWVVNSTRTTAPDLKDALIRDIRQDNSVGSDFVGDRLHLVVGLLDRRIDRPVSQHRTSRLDSC